MSNYGCGCGNTCVGCGCPKTSVGQGMARTPSVRDVYLSRGITSHVPHTSWRPNPYVWHTPSQARQIIPR